MQVGHHKVEFRATEGVVGLHEVGHRCAILLQVKEVGTFLGEEACPGESKILGLNHVSTEARESNGKHPERVLDDRPVVCAFKFDGVSFVSLTVLDAEYLCALFQREQLSIVLVAVANDLFSEKVCYVCLNRCHSDGDSIVVSVGRHRVARDHSAFVMVPTKRPVRQVVEAGNSTSEVRVSGVHGFARNGVLT